MEGFLGDCWGEEGGWLVVQGAGDTAGGRDAQEHVRASGGRHQENLLPSLTKKSEAPPGKSSPQLQKWRLVGARDKLGLVFCL